MGRVARIMNISKINIEVSEKIVTLEDEDKRKLIGDGLIEISKSVKNLYRNLYRGSRLNPDLFDGSKDMLKECEAIKKDIAELNNLTTDYKFLDELSELFNSKLLIEEIVNAPKSAIEALKIGRAGSNFEIAGEIIKEKAHCCSHCNH